MQGFYCCDHLCSFHLIFSQSTAWLKTELFIVGEESSTVQYIKVRLNSWVENLVLKVEVWMCNYAETWKTQMGLIFIY